MRLIDADYFPEYIFEEYHNMGRAFNKALEIIKSATNGKEEG